MRRATGGEISARSPKYAPLSTDPVDVEGGAVDADPSTIVQSKLKVIFGASVALILFIMASVYVSQTYRSKQEIDTGRLQVATWNIAAINNNPFEYWLTLNDPFYDTTMEEVQRFITSPGSLDVYVSSVFSNDMFEDLVKKMKKNKNFKNNAIKGVVSLWNSDFKNRKIVSQFMKDPLLGLKRLTSMPDRVTNTIPLAQSKFAYRPTVINCYQSSLNNVKEWWPKWLKFMFDDSLNTVKMGSVIPANMLKIIPRAKYKELSELEEEISIPLQTLVGAIFDSILVHMMTHVDIAAGKGNSGKTWQSLRTQICESLNLKKNHRLIEILETSYGNMDIVCLQEVAASFMSKLQSSSILMNSYHLVKPAKLSSSDQNSVVLLSKKKFPKGITEDLTKYLKFDDPKMVAQGDVLIVHATDHIGRNFVVGSFHGDTNGMATIPVVKSVLRLLHKEDLFVFGMDANTYEHGKPGKTQDVTEFADTLNILQLGSVRGDVPDPTDYTTFNARTFLQPQLNKASSKSEIRSKGDVNPKDFIIYFKKSMSSSGFLKDNTGNREYQEEMVFPTLQFPSDHGVMFTALDLPDRI